MQPRVAAVGFSSSSPIKALKSVTPFHVNMEVFLALKASYFANSNQKSKKPEFNGIGLVFFYSFNQEEYKICSSKQ